MRNVYKLNKIKKISLNKNKIIKIYVSVITVIVMILSNYTLSIASQANLDSSHKEKSTAIIGMYKKEKKIIYSVKITWGDMKYTYTPEYAGDWNTDTHTYSNSVTGGWSVNNDNGDIITVTNYSNASISAKFTYDNTQGVTSVTGRFSNDTLNIDTAEDKIINDTRLVAESKLMLSGKPSQEWDDSKKLGDVTVTVK